jgi:hypothetical protein
VGAGFAFLLLTFDGIHFGVSLFVHHERIMTPGLILVNPVVFLSQPYRETLSLVFFFLVFEVT